MTEREKMAQIIAEHLCPQGKAHKTLYGAARMCYSRDNFADCEKVSDCVDALIEAGFISLKESLGMARKACDILRNIKDDEIKRICKERDDFARREEIAELVCDAMSETLFAADGGCDEICLARDDECIRLKVAFYCGEVGIADRKIHCFKRWYKYACDEALKKRPNNFKAKIERGRKDDEETK